MARFTPKTFTSLLRRMAWRVVARSKLTDLEPGGQLITILGAVARELDDVYYQMTNLQRLWDLDTATGEDLDRRAIDVNPDEIIRLGATVATGSVVFSRTVTTDTVAIPAGSVVRVGTTSVEYETTAAGEITSGLTDSLSIGIVALVPGEDGNCDAAAVDSLDPISGVETVSNTTACSGGQSGETDQQLRDRIRLYLRSLSRGTPDAIKYAALSVSLDGYGRVVAAEVVEGTNADLGKVWVYIDDGQGTAEVYDDNYGTPEDVVTTATGGEDRVWLDNKPVKPGEVLTVRWTDSTAGPTTHTLIEGDDFTLNDATGQIDLIAGGTAAIPTTGLNATDAVDAEYTWFEGLVAEVQKIIDGDAADRSNYPGYRSAGVHVEVAVPTVYWQFIEGSVAVEDGYDEAEVIAAVENALLRYVNGLGINGDVIFSELVYFAQSIPGVFDVEYANPTANVVIGSGELARIKIEDIDVAGA